MRIQKTCIFIVSVIFMACLLNGVTLTFAQQKFAIYENFENAEPIDLDVLQAPVSHSYVVGGSTVGCTTSKDRGITIATAPDNRYGKSLKQFMTEEYSEDHYFEVSYSPEKNVGGSVYFESSIFLETMNYVGIRFKGDNDTKARLFPILFCPDGTTPGLIQIMGVSTGKTWSLNTWYDIKIKWNLSTGYYEADVYEAEKHYTSVSGYVNAEKDEYYLYDNIYCIELYHLLKPSDVKESFGTKNQIAYWDNIKLEIIPDFTPESNSSQRIINFEGFNGMLADGSGMPGNSVIWECQAEKPIESYNTGSEYGTCAHINLPASIGSQTDTKITCPTYRMALGQSLAPTLNVSPIKNVFHFKASIKINDLDGLFSLYSDNSQGKDHLLYFYDGKIGAFGNVSQENYDKDVWYDIDVIYDVNTGQYSVSVIHPSNSQKTISWQGYYDKHVGDNNFWDFYLRIDRNPVRGYDKYGNANMWAYNNPTSILVDNLYIGEFSEQDVTVSNDYIAKLGEIINHLNDSIAFYLNCDVAIAENGINNLSHTCFMENDKFYVPLNLVSDKFNAIVEISDNNVLINDKDVNSDIKIIDGNKYISIDSFAKICGLYIFKDDLSDLYIIGRNKIDYTWENDRRILSGIIGNMIFDFPYSSQIVSDVQSKFNVGQHPRILATNTDFERIKRTTTYGSADFEPLKKQWLDSIESQRAIASARDTVEYGPTDHIRMRQQSETFYEVVTLNAFMYKLTGNNEYAQRAWLEISKICSDDFPDWNPVHLLDTGQFMNAISVGYDWLYDWLSSEQRALIRRNIIDKGLNVMCEIFDGNYVYSSWADFPRGYPFYTSVDNWNFVCCGGALMASLAIFDECDGQDRYKCERVMQETVKILSYSATCFSPTGDWYEGPAYWALANETMTEACIALLNSAGTDYGIMDAPGVSTTCQIPFSLIGEYTFNYSNAGAVKAGGLPNTRELFFHANRFNRVDYAKARFMLMDEYNITPDFRDLIYCTQTFNSDSLSLKTDYYLKNSEIVTMRNADVDEGLIFAGIHGGANKPAQGHLDVGQFVIDSFGDRFAEDLGLEDYNLLVEYYHKYRNRAEGHNTLVINPDDRTYDQDLEGNGIIVRNEYNKASSIAVVDMTSAYTGYADSAVRGMKFINNRTSILIQDEVRGVAKKLNNENEIYWFMHTKADITLKDNNRVAVLDVNGNKMYATLLTDGEFGVMNANPLPTSPNPAGQNTNSEYKKLYIHLKNVTDVNIAVCFTPILYYGAYSLPDVVPLSEWQLDISNVKQNIAKLSSIRINGESLSEFDGSVFSYEYSQCDAGTIPTIEATGNGEIFIDYPRLLPAPARIIVTNDDCESVYTIFLSEKSDKYENEQFKLIPVQSAFSNGDNSYCSVDKNTQTSVALKTSDYITYELVDILPVNYINIVGENLNLSVYYSDDGVDYIFISETNGNGEASVFTVSSLAKYIKLVSKSDGCVISEFNAYGFDGYEYESDSYSNITIDFITALYEKDNASSLCYVNVQTACINSEFNLFDIITIPDDGKKYEIAVYVWMKDKLIPLIKRVNID